MFRSLRYAVIETNSTSPHFFCRVIYIELGLFIKNFWYCRVCKYQVNKFACVINPFFRLPGTERRHHWKSSSCCLPPPAPTSSRGLLPFPNEAFAPIQLFGNTSVCWCTRMHRAYEGGSQLHHGKAVLE